MQKTIIFDLNGNDLGIEPGIRASEIFLANNPEYSIILLGDETAIKQYLPNHLQIKIHHAPQAVSKSLDNFASSFKEDNSLNTALKLLKDQQGSAVLSSADSGKYLLSAMMLLKCIPNVSRPAFMSIVPTIDPKKKFLLLDEGANLNTTSNHLVQWAHLGASFAKTVLKINQPRVGLINIGTEDYKGFPFHQEAHQELKNQTLNFEYLGFIEPRKILEATCDVAVADGFTGNITLKTLEGTVLAFAKLLKKRLRQNWFRKLMAAALKPAFKEIKEQLDYRNVGAAWILGINGLVIKAHGSSDQKAYVGALNQIKMAIESNALAEFKKALE